MSSSERIWRSRSALTFNLRPFLEGPPENLCMIRTEIHTTTCPFRSSGLDEESKAPKEGHVSLSSLVRKTLALKNHRVIRVVEENGRLVVALDWIKRRRLPCSVCGKPSKVRERSPERSWRHVPLWGIEVELRYRPCRVSCRSCSMVKVEAIPWATGKSPISKPLMVALATWSRLLACDVVARLFGVSWSTVVVAVNHAVDYGLERRDLSRLRYLGIDEISRKKGHVYHTNVYDLETKTLEWSFDSIGSAQSAQIVGICCDMWANYVDVVKRRASQAVLVFDKFHIVRHLLAAVNDVRTMEAKAIRAIAPETLKGTRYLFLKNPENLTDKQAPRLAEIMKMNLKVVRAYLLKELFKDLWT